MAEGPQEITNLVDREVYSKNGVFVGVVQDLNLDLRADHVVGLALTQINRRLFGDRVDGARGVIIPYRMVHAVGDVILVHDAVERVIEASDDDD